MEEFDKVRRIEIEINTQCNRSCSYCPNSIASRLGKKLMDKETFKKIIETFRTFDYKWYVAYHFYGEPLLHPELEDFVKITKKVLPRSRPIIYTNGVLLDEAKLISLANAGAGFIITKQEQDVTIPYEQFPENFVEKYKHVVKYHTYKDLLYTNRGGLLGVKQEKLKDRLPLQRSCFIPSSNITITIDGNILPCFEDYGEQHVMGNILSQKFEDIWMSPEYVVLRNDLKKGERAKHRVCSRCDSIIYFV